MCNLDPAALHGRATYVAGRHVAVTYITRVAEGR
jgi:hypothetical protein